MKSIRSKLWLIFTALVVFILGIVWIFQVVLLNNFYLNERKNSIIEESKTVNSLYIESMENKDQSSLSYSFDYLRENGKLHTFFFIFDKDDRLVFPEEGSRRGFVVKFTDKELLRNLIPIDKSKNTYTVITDKDIDEKLHIKEGSEARKVIFKKSMLVSSPIHDSNGQYIGRSIFVSNLIPLRETSNILKKQLSIITAISVVIGSMLALYFSKQFTKPIIKITHATRDIAKGKFDTRVDIASKDEIGILGEDVNKMAHQLGMIEELRKDFISNVTHELKTPIGIIRAYAELIRDINDEETKADNVKVIVDESIRLNEMVEDILTLSKMEAGYDKLTLEKNKLPSLLEDVLTRLQVLIENKNINILLDYEEDFEIECDYNKMFQVFYNIINNSINHSESDSDISINMYKDISHKVIIEIKDQGSGISKDEVNKIWDRFYKVEKSRTRTDSGTGLGMSIVKNIIDLHGFDVELDSEVGVGTVVKIKI
ncbi:MAG: HAMP domain-containing histidine kinase [Firmicutes bacterium]|jgi:signal transduction histidine kinase|nr:HAMP domain-containing histidine kinase [Bacillota bacterium]